MKMNKEVVMVRLSDIIPNRFQPRLTFDEEALNELSSSIKEHGIIQPLILRDLGNKYEIIAGERRYKAATLAGLTEVPAIVGSMDDQTSAEVALIENIQRKDLSAIEEAKSYQKVLEIGSLTQDTLAKRMGKSQSAIANKMRLLTLTNEVQVALMNNLISERHARCLLQIKDEDKQKEVLNKIIAERMNVRDTDNYIKEILGISKDTSSSNNSAIDLPNKIEESKDNTTENPEKIPHPMKTPTENQPIVPEKETSTTHNNNPNVYTQTENVDFVNISDLNNDNDEPSINLEEVPSNTETIPSNADNVVEEINLDNNINNETIDINPDIPSPAEESSPNKKPSSNNNMTKLKFASAIKLAKDATEVIKTIGYNASFEEDDDDKEYRLIITIKKDE